MNSSTSRALTSPTSAVGPAIPLPHWVDSPQALAAALASQPIEARVHWMRSLGASQLARLWALSLQSTAPLPPSALVGSDEDGLGIARGKNHLPVFSWFEKRFVRVGDDIIGYNHTGWLASLVGPGVFTVRQTADPAELLIDYGRPPLEGHPALPALSDNQRLGGWPAPLERLVYGGGMVDRLRHVGSGLLVGRSETDGFSLNAGATFALMAPRPDALARG